MSPQARSWLGHCWLSFIRKPLRALPREHLPSTNVCRINELSKKFTGVHRIWPKDRPDSKPSLDAVMSQTQIEKKVKDYLRNSQALEDYWQRPITAEQLQAEMDRMAKHTKQPEVLRELFEALGNDPFVIAECLARPALVIRLLHSAQGSQDVDGKVKRQTD
jgi:hypothetical protein